VKKIVEEHGGALWAENGAGGGARVALRLPLSPVLTAESTHG